MCRRRDRGTSLHSPLRSACFATVAWRLPTRELPQVSLCKTGDSFIEERVSGIYRCVPPPWRYLALHSTLLKPCPHRRKNKEMLKGVAFPTCISVNHCVCANSPTDEVTDTLKTGDVVKMCGFASALLSMQYFGIYLLG
jgi:hypothetical protein